MSRLADFKRDGASSLGVPMSTIADIDVVVHGFEVKEGKYGPLYVVDVELPDESRVSVYTGAIVVKKALDEALANDAFPLQARFVRTKKYWDVQ